MPAGDEESREENSWSLQGLKYLCDLFDLTFLQAFPERALVLAAVSDRICWFRNMMQVRELFLLSFRS